MILADSIQTSFLEEIIFLQDFGYKTEPVEDKSIEKNSFKNGMRLVFMPLETRGITNYKMLSIYIKIFEANLEKKYVLCRCIPEATKFKDGRF